MTSWLSAGAWVGSGHTMGRPSLRAIRKKRFLVARGVDKFVIRSASPFLVIVNHAGEFRGQGLEEPLQTIRSVCSV